MMDIEVRVISPVVYRVEEAARALRLRRSVVYELPDGFEVVSSWVFVGRGYVDLDQTAAAVTAATLARSR